MYKFLKNLLCLLVVMFAFSACRKQALDDFYGRPASLAQPVYQVMQQRGNFTNFLALVDKAGYTSTLSSAGYWTLFAPNDDAFKKYFTAHSITSVSQIDVPTATAIVTYAMVYSGYVSISNGNLSGASIDFIQPISAGYTTTGTSVFFTNGVAFKRKTVYHEGVYQDTIPNFTNFGTLAGKKVSMIANDRNIAYDYKDFNNKYIPYFTHTYNVGAADYNYFFPGVTYTDSEANFNVLNGNVVNANIVCENGILDEINTVPVPLPSLEKTLYTNSNYSHFYQFIQRYGNLVTYVLDPNATHVYNVNTGSTDPVYVKQYSSLLAYSFGNENFVLQGGGTLDPQGNGWTMFAPNNAAFDAYVKNVLLEHYSSVSLLPQSIILDFINAHLAQTTIWPSQFNLSTNLNFNKELIRINPNTDVQDKIICSNGLFYGTTKVQATNVFTTVFGRPYLDPAYSMMTKELTYYNYKISLANPNFKYTLLMVPDATLIKAGFGVNAALQGANPAQTGLTLNGSSGATADNTLLRILNLGIYSTPNNELSDVNSSSIYATVGLGGYAPEYVKFANNTIIAAGNQETGTAVSVNPTYVTASNGIVYYPTSTNTALLIPSTATPSATSPTSYGQDIFNKAQVAPVNGVGGDPYYYFFKFLSSANIPTWNAAAKSIQGIDVGSDYTIFIPTNAAILDAVNNGWLPGTGTGSVKTPNFLPTTTADVNLVVNFIKYHILKGIQVVPDGKKTGAFTTQLFNSDGSAVSVNINNVTKNSMTIIDGQGRVANVGQPASALLADHVVIQTIDTYLQYYDYTSVSAANPNPTKY